ncbi:MAG TPA: hypothetical protein VKR27_03835 [Acidimicrobiales bacterium]|nr:hypothetical protein [Acidimicrobiales bacterium]
MTFADRDVGAVPRRSAAPDLDLGSNEGRRRDNNRGPDTPADLDDD